MRAVRRIVMLAVLATFTSALAACSDFDTDKLDVFGLNEKKKLPGERKELFPGGVPGVTQGIPPEFVKGNQPPPDTAQALPSDAAAAEADKKTAAVEPEQKPKPKRAPKPQTASRPPTQITVPRAPQDAAQQQQTPWPQQDQQPAPQQGQSPWPAQGQTNATAPWPSSPQPGTFSR
ncbi:MAG TPA: hypothetical protein VKD19_03125 [Pseudolabrys sp.]|nr:hypothetical protein [Pseudolabrys sp.]